MKEAKKQHHSILREKSHNKIKATRSIIKKDSQSTFSAAGSHLTGE
jgi:hypothetical protein